MSATAKLLQDKGYTVTGSDDACYPPASDYVEKLGITFTPGYRPENVPEDVDLIVIGRNAQLDPKTNTEVQHALTCGVPVKSYPEVLRELGEGMHRIVVAGSYGKSTVTALLSWALMDSGKDPAYFIGAYPYGMEYTSTLGKGEVFVIEGDEYPTAHGDDRSKFLHYTPRDVLLTSVDHDHVNVFPTYEEYKVPFRELASQLPPDGLLVACADNAGALEIAERTPARVVTYGIHKDATWTAENITYGEHTTFALYKDGGHITNLTTTLLGAHNVQNIVGAAALLLERKLVTPGELRDAIARFGGVRRRMNKITTTSTVPVYEGFGSSYEKARAAIEAILLHYPNRNLVVLFEPHTFSWRNRDALGWYDNVFKEAAHVLVYHPATQGSTTHAQLTQEEIVTRIAASGTPATAVNTQDETLEALRKAATPQSVVLVLTSGNFDGILDMLPGWFDESYHS